MPGALPLPQAAPATALPPVQQQGYDLTKPSGMVVPGNLDPWHRKRLENGNGTYSTTLSFGIGTDKGETVIPQVVAGKLLTKRQAIAHFNKTGQNLGSFATPEAADAYAQALHNAQAAYINGGMKGTPPTVPLGALQTEKPYVAAPKLPAGPIPKAMLDQMRAKP